MENPIRVLCVFSTLDRGGAESMCMELYRHIDRSKVQFDFVKHTSQIGAFEEEIYSLGGRVFEAPRLRVGTVFKYRRWWKRHFLDYPEHKIIHGHFFTISPVYFQIAKQFSRITIGHIHISKASDLKKAIFAKFISRFTDYPLACSYVAGKWVYGNRDFTVLNNAIDMSAFRANPLMAVEVRDELNIKGRLVVGNVSRFNIQKNPYGIVEIFNLVHKKCPNSKLIWVGDGPLKREMQIEVTKQGLQDEVIFTGVRNDVGRLLQAMDAFILPSFYEGLPVSAIEAQAAGIHCFVSDSISNEVVVTDLCQRLPLDNLDYWATQICKIRAGYTHPDMTDQINDAGYDIHATANWLQEFYISVSSKI